jgi:GntR family transcriptional regulator
LDERLPRYQQLHVDLVRRIATGEWLPGEPIPTEAQLSSAYEVSTGTLRKAVDLLVAEGVLTRSQGKGTFVRRPQIDSSMLRFFRFKSPGGDPVLPTARVLKREVTAPDEEVRQALQLRRNDHVIRLSRLRLLDALPVLAEEIWLPRARFAPLVGLPLQDFEDLLYPQYERLCQQVVATARETLFVRRADKVLAKQLSMGAGEPIIHVRRVAFDFASKAVEFRTTSGRASGFQYEIEIR